MVGVLVADDPIGPVDEQPAVLLRDAEDAGEGPHGQVGGELHVVRRALPGDRVDEGARPLLDRALQLTHRARGEGGGDDAAQPDVAGRVLVEHHGLDEGQVAGGVGVADLGGAEVGGVDLRRAQDVLDVGVAEDGPVAGAGGPGADGRLGHPAHGRVVAQPPEEGVRHAVGIGGRVEDGRGVGDRLGCAHRRTVRPPLAGPSRPRHNVRVSTRPEEAVKIPVGGTPE